MTYAIWCLLLCLRPTLPQVCSNIIWNETGPGHMKVEDQSAKTYTFLKNTFQDMTPPASPFFCGQAFANPLRCYFASLLLSSRVICRNVCQHFYLSPTFLPAIPLFSFALSHANHSLYEAFFGSFYS